MIGFLRGILLDKDAPNITLEVGGIGYEVQLSLNSFAKLPEIDQEIALYIHLAKREDGEFLYGFNNKEQRLLFRSLVKISNIGPKIALAILNAMEPQAFVQHLVNNDTAALEHIPGIGAKTAKRLLVEMRDKISDWQLGTTELSGTGHDMRDALGALVALGYKPHEAREALSSLKDQHVSSSEELVRLALKKIK